MTLHQTEHPPSDLRNTLFLLGPNLGWVVLYAGAWAWFLTGHELSDVFINIFIYDLVINMATPWILVPLLIAYAFWLGRSTIRSIRLMLGALLIVGLCGLLLWAAVTILHHYGGWSLVAVVPVLASKLSWRSLKSKAAGGFNSVLLRSILAPLFCFAPAVVICCLVFQRNTLGENQSDYVGLFGIIYFGAQAALDYLLAIGGKGKGPFALAGVRSGSAASKNISSSSSTGTQLIEAVLNKNAAKVKILLNEGADVQQKGQDECTALHHAAASGEPEIAAMLVQYGADVQAVDAHGLTPLHVAFLRDNHEMIRMLVRLGANPEQPMPDGRSLLDVAKKMENAELIKILQGREQ